MAESMNGLHRSHRCTEVSSANIGETVTVMGWVQKRRNLGSLIFADLRDRSGLLQIIFDSNDIPDCPMDWEPENQDDLPHVGDVVWAFVKDGGSFQLYVKQMVVSKKDDAFLYLSAGNIGCRFTRPEWMKSVFPTEQEANDGLKKYLAESRYSVD